MKPGDRVSVKVGAGRVNAVVISTSETANRSGKVIVEFVTRAGKTCRYVRKPNQVSAPLTCVHPRCDAPTEWVDPSGDVWCLAHKQHSPWYGAEVT